MEGGVVGRRGERARTDVEDEIQRVGKGRSEAGERRNHGARGLFRKGHAEPRKGGGSAAELFDFCQHRAGLAVEGFSVQRLVGVLMAQMEHEVGNFRD